MPFERGQEKFKQWTILSVVSKYLLPTLKDDSCNPFRVTVRLEYSGMTAIQIGF